MRKNEEKRIDGSRLKRRLTINKKQLRELKRRSNENEY
jgi:hypothetical protein